MQSGRRLLVVGLFVVAIAASSAALAEPTVTEAITRYDVTGATPEEVSQQMHTIGPIDNTEKKHFSAVTRWNINWRYTYNRKSDACSISSVSVAVTVNYTTPRLVSNDVSLNAMFDRYYANLMTHERGHAANGIEAARNIEKAIAAMAPLPTCEALGVAANELGRSLIAPANKKDIEYDAATQHGRTQGAHLP